MKHLIKKFIRIVLKCIYSLYNYNIKKYLQNKKNLLFSYWIRNSFKKCGNEIRVQSPVYIIGNKYITIGEDFHALERLRLECWDEFEERKFVPNITIGNHVVMNYNVHIGCINKVYIGNNVLFGSNVLITDHQHGFVDHRDLNIAPNKRFLSTTGPVIIEDNVWIGENVSIMPNITIGKGCIIGANSVVTKSFPENSVLAGIPAKLIKSLDTNP